MGRPGGGPAAVAWLAAREISRQPEKSVGWPRGPLGWLGVSVRWPRMRQAVSAPSHPAIQPSSQPLHHAASPPAAQPDRPKISHSAVAAWQPARRESVARLRPISKLTHIVFSEIAYTKNTKMAVLPGPKSGHKSLTVFWPPLRFYIRFIKEFRYATVFWVVFLRPFSRHRLPPDSQRWFS